MNDLFARVTLLEREVERLQALAARLLAIEAAPRSRFEQLIYYNEKPMGPDGFEREPTGVTPEFEPMTVTDTAVELWAGKYELRITVSTAHGFHDENEVTLADASPYNGTHRVRVISPTEFAILSEAETFSPPSFGGGGATVTKEPGAVRLMCTSIEALADEGDPAGFILASAVNLMLNDSIRTGPYYLSAGALMIIASDPLSRKPQNSLYCTFIDRCFVPVDAG
jgi:hypothetical protein